jgi:GntR family transcriptional regulator
MEFRDSQAIYLQIADLVCENILGGRWKEGDRVPSIRELSAMIEVNPNTVVRSYALLQEQQIIHNQRGIGYFVAAEAHGRTVELKRKSFVNRQLPPVFRTMELLGLDFEDLKALHKDYKNNTKERSA